MTDTPFTTFTPPGFEDVTAAFKANFEDGLEHGAQFCAYKDGELIADLTGGWKDRGKTVPMAADDLVAVFSSGKVPAALVIAMLADSDRIGYDQLVSSFWPEFAAEGKGELTVGQVMSHQSGLSGITQPGWTSEDWFDWDKTVNTLAAQTPIWEPGTACGYHPVTYGFLAGEICRRADKQQRSIGQILKEEFVIPHGLDIWIGLPEEHHHRCADMRKPQAVANMGEINEATKAAFLMPGASPGRKGESAAWRTAEFAGSNCHATAKSLAQIMQMVVDGSVCGQQYLAEDMQEKLRQPRISGPNLVLPFDITFAAGIMLNTNGHYGPNPDTLGHSGWGGSCVFADPDNGITGAYAMTKQSNALLGDPRPMRIIDALYRVI